VTGSRFRPCPHHLEWVPGSGSLKQGARFNMHTGGRGHRAPGSKVTFCRSRSQGARLVVPQALQKIPFA
jgi:hypothetical protein